MYCFDLGLTPEGEVGTKPLSNFQGFRSEVFKIRGNNDAFSGVKSQAAKREALSKTGETTFENLKLARAPPMSSAQPRKAVC